MSSRAATVLTVVLFLLFCYATAATLVSLSALARVESLEQQIVAQQRWIDNQARRETTERWKDYQFPSGALFPDESIACDRTDALVGGTQDEDCY